MAYTSEHRSKWGSKATLLLCSCDSNALGSEMTPILAVIAMAFPGEDVSLLVALPPLFIIPATFIAGWAARRISRKTILTIGQLLFIIGGLGGAFVDSYELLIATRVFFGLGCGLVYTTVPTLISYFYKGQERVQMMGLANAVGSIIAMTFSVISGTLAVIGWHFPFYINIFFIFVLIMQLVFLPKVPPENQLESVKKADTLTKQERSFGYRTWACILLMFTSMTMSMVYLVRLAMFMQQNNIGDSVMAGFASSATTGTALIVALLFPIIFKKLGRYTLIISIGAIAVSYTLLSMATTAPMLFAGCIVFGLYLATLIPALQTLVSGLVHPYRRTWALSILTTALFAGQACASLFVNFIGSIVGDVIANQFMAMAGIFGVMLAVVVIFLLVTRNKAELPYANVTDLDD